MRFGEAAVILAAVSNITVSPVPPSQEEADTLSQGIQKPLLTDDFPVHFIKSIVHLNEVMPGASLATLEVVTLMPQWCPDQDVVAV